MRKAWAAFVVACQLLTIIPFPGGTVSIRSSKTFASSLQWFPIVGFLLGGGLFAIDWGLGMFLDDYVRNMVLLALYVWIIGGLHQDGLADTIDAFAGGKNSEHRLAILRDSHIGALGATGLFLALGLRYAGFLALPPVVREMVLLSMPAVGRWSLVVGSWRAISPRQEGLAVTFLQDMRGFDLFMASFFAAIGLILILNWIPTLGVLIVGYGMVRSMVWWFTQKFGGMTGDLLGTVNECIEILFLIAAPFILQGR